MDNGQAPLNIKTLISVLVLALALTGAESALAKKPQHSSATLRLHGVVPARPHMRVVTGAQGFTPSEDPLLEVTNNLATPVKLTMKSSRGPASTTVLVPPATAEGEATQSLPLSPSETVQIYSLEAP